MTDERHRRDMRGSSRTMEETSRMEAKEQPMHDRGFMLLWSWIMTVAVIGLLSMTQVAQAFTVTRIANIYLDPGGSRPEGFTHFRNELVFSAAELMTGTELWSYDGHQVRQLADIRPGALGSGPLLFTVLGDELVFIAFDDTTGQELWSYDGHQVRQLADINPAGSSFPISPTVFRHELVFSADDGMTGRELWRLE